MDPCLSDDEFVAPGKEMKLFLRFMGDGGQEELGDARTGRYGIVLDEVVSDAVQADIAVHDAPCGTGFVHEG